ncbi:MAG TPA: glycoside hydrolase family 71/99-like protein [Ferruginibacter sp.]|nr:glycoside hydrolase family 71/99-like protein [Ferruginibacter sp.]HMP22387.1 glycoside hydrolase family 71/99-like protein [Ferruginibacter sp.]
MKKICCYAGIVLVLVACKKTGTPGPSPDVWDGIIRPAAPVTVAKTATQKIFVHYMPWFETPQSLVSCCNWGIHWTMNRGATFPNTFVSGQRRIAAHYYPMIGPYASSDTNVIDYQLLLMKLSGIDGLMIDWPGTGTNLGESMDLPLNARNTKAIVDRLSKVGLKYALVYEDQYVSRYTDKAAAAKNDINYARDNYFNDPNYEQYEGKPLFMVFGPQAVTTGAGWTTVFSELPVKPAFFTLWYERHEAAGNTTGEYAWIDQSHTTRLNNFYAGSYNPGVKISSVYPGFKTYYTEGGWPGPTWTIAANGTNTFVQLLDLALKQFTPYLQLNTWNDYGEGTMLEPTSEASGGFGYKLLTALQDKLGVAGLNQADLETVQRYYELKVANAGNAGVMNKLTQVYYYMVSLQMGKARELLATI